ncbi:succinate dehydrogenase [Prochlorococcus marinus]|uniref:succinate dehydrogenase n=1 Tax=Prochlorococcus marinus TaxID=1219 RepID=UPI0022B47A05|nr:succinate dehydrogenase [Prochlorococcus marinus]
MLLLFFLVIHLLGLFIAIIAPIPFELYATALHSASWVIMCELCLVAIALTHIFLTLVKVISNSQNGSNSNLVSRRKNFLAIFAARSQPIGGVVLLYFLFIHLGQLRFPRPADGSELVTLQLFLSSPVTSSFYILSSLALLLHLFHGIESSQRSLGLLTPLNSSLIRALGRGLSVIISGGFILVTALIGRSMINY